MADTAHAMCSTSMFQARTHADNFSTTELSKDIVQVIHVQGL